MAADWKKKVIVDSTHPFGNIHNFISKIHMLNKKEGKNASALKLIVILLGCSRS